MASEPVSTRSRRALLATAAAGVAGAVADSLSRAKPVAGATGGNFILGQLNSADTYSRLDNTAAGGLALDVRGSAGGIRTSGTDYGVWGDTDLGTAVYGVCGNSGYAIRGENFSLTNPSILGSSYRNNTGVQGWSGPNGGLAPTSPVKTGVYGSASQDANARGVTGETTAGRGVNGVATSGTGVYGTGTGGEGVRGVSTGSNGTAGTTASGIASGVYGENTGGGFGTYGRSNNGTSAVGVFGESTNGTGVKANSANGTAFEAQGRVKFSTTGLVTVAVGGKNKVVTPGIPLNATSMILCTLESNQAGLSIQRVTKNTAAGSFTVFLSKGVALGKTAKIAWFLIG